jgi:curved DNA-binding protein CbpA
MNPSKDYYAVLGVLPDAELIVIHAAFRALANRYHPDKWPGDRLTAETRMRELNEAHEILSNEGKRAGYDALRKRRANAGPSTGDYQRRWESAGKPSAGVSRPKPPPKPKPKPFLRESSSSVGAILLVGLIGASVAIRAHWLTADESLALVVGSQPPLAAAPMNRSDTRETSVSPLNQSTTDSARVPSGEAPAGGWVGGRPERASPTGSSVAPGANQFDPPKLKTARASRHPGDWWEAPAAWAAAQPRVPTSAAGASWPTSAAPAANPFHQFDPPKQTPDDEALRR